MTKIPKPLLKSLAIIDSVLLFVFLAYFLNVIFDSLAALTNSFLAFLLCFPLNIIFYSGILPSLIDLVTEERFIISFPLFQENLKAFWKIYLTFQIITLGLSVITPGFIFKYLGISSELTHLFLKFFSFYLLCAYLFFKKYLEPKKLSLNSINISYANSLLFVCTFLLQLTVFCLPLITEVNFRHMANILGFLNSLLDFFGFIYFGNVLYHSSPPKNQPKELFLINPMVGSVFASIALSYVRNYPPVFVIFKALTPKNYKIQEFNRVLWQKNFYKPDVLVAITCYSSNCYEAYKIALEFKRRGAKVVMGGPHVNYFPEEALNYCDSVVVGNAESVWKDIVKDYEAGTLKQKYFKEVTAQNHGEIFHELIQSPPEMIKEFLEPTRGCKFKCHFCAIPGLNNQQFEINPVEEIKQLIQKIRYKYDFVSFRDNNIFNDPDYVRDLFKTLKPLKIRWDAGTSIDIAQNVETLKLAKESGCTGLAIGYEIYGGSLENQQKGKFALVEKYLDYSHRIKQLGIQIKAHYILGFESDSFQNLSDFWRFCFKVMPSITALSLLTPIPGSKLFLDMLAQNRLTNLNWKHYNFHELVFRHQKMNRRLLSLTFPLIRTFFFFTTSSMGFRLLFISTCLIFLTFILK